MASVVESKTLSRASVQKPFSRLASAVAVLFVWQKRKMRGDGPSSTVMSLRWTRTPLTHFASFDEPRPFSWTSLARKQLIWLTIQCHIVNMFEIVVNIVRVLLEILHSHSN